MLSVTERARPPDQCFPHPSIEKATMSLRSSHQSKFRPVVDQFESRTLCAAGLGSAAAQTQLAPTHHVPAAITKAEQSWALIVIENSPKNEPIFFSLKIENKVTGATLDNSQSGTVYPDVKDAGGFTYFTYRWQAADKPKFLVTFNNLKEEVTKTLTPIDKRTASPPVQSFIKANGARWVFEPSPTVKNEIIVVRKR
jgi:hypothetical protein